MIDRATALKAAEAANTDFQQWMPQQWLDLFIQHYERLDEIRVDQKLASIKASKKQNVESDQRESLPAKRD